MIVAAALNLLVFSLSGLYMLYLGGWTSVTPCTILVWIESIVNIVLLVLDLHLVFFHIYLKCKGLSTIDMILKRERE
jgi:NADH:ubiquinone oxidoreductase subunit H